MKGSDFIKVREQLLFDSNQHYAIDELEECPLCHFSIKPKKLAIHPYWHDQQKYAGGLYLCNHCYQVFCQLSVCLNTEITIDGKKTFDTKSIYVGPTRFSEYQFDQPIKDISPQFIKIYNQAFSAENQHLDEIAGIGYRKSLEFLVKDFCIHLHPDLEEEIKKKPLAQCINNYIDYPQIKILAEKATWIGNDETHYTRKIEDRDLSDMKKFIDAIVYFVCMVLITEDAGTITHA